MQKSESIAALAGALAKAQAEMQGAKKDAENPFFKSKYADLASVWEACRASLSKNGLSVIQTTLPTDENGAIPIETMLAHSSGEWVSGTLKVLPKADDPQSMGSALTYGRRYSLAAMVGVAPEDDDGNAASQGNGKPAQKTAPPPPRPSQKATEVTAIKKSLVDCCRLLNEAGDKPTWSAKRLDEFSIKEFGTIADRLELEPLRDLQKRLSGKLDELKMAAKLVAAAETEAIEDEIPF